tara:strand:+ start:49481 stop:50263 length:783 start_codon:yes stop_codon:yes gene_type:complete
MRFGKDIITKLVRSSVSLATLPAGSVLTIGGVRKKLSSAITCNTAIIGPGGMEVAVTVNTFYYVYAIIDSGVVKLIATTSEVNPLGYNAHRKVGAFFVENGVEIFEVRGFGSDINGEETTLDFNYSGSTMGVDLTENGARYKMINGKVKGTGNASIPTSNTNSAYLVLPRGLIKRSTIQNNDDLGRCIRINVGENDNAFFMLISGSPSDDKMYLTRVASTNSNPATTVNWNSILASGNTFTFDFECAIEGWPEQIDWNLY